MTTIDLGKAKIGKLNTDEPLTYEGRGGDTVTLTSGSATINGEPMEVGKEYTLKSGDELKIFKGTINA